MNDADSTRQKQIVGALVEAFADLMEADPSAFRTKFRKMAANPFAFYRGSACLFYNDIRDFDDPWADERTSRVWIHGDLHLENFGTYMNSEGTLVFDVNDFDEAYVGHFSWDLRRFVASLALMGWQKALPESDVRALAETYLRTYVEQVMHYVQQEADDAYALRLDNSRGSIHDLLLQARLATRVSLLDSVTVLDDYDRHFRRGRGVRELDENERDTVCESLDAYIERVPPNKRSERPVFYRIKDVVGRKGFGIGSAGLPAYNVLIEGATQALENDIVLSIKQGNVAAPSRIVDEPAVRNYFEHEGHRTVVSQRALQVHTDPLLGYTEIGDTGFVVAELSPYELDLDWSDLTEPEEIAPVLEDLGRATAKVHCVSDEDSDQTLVTFQTEDAIHGVIEGRLDQFVEEIIDFGLAYAEVSRKDHQLFVEAFREGDIAGVSAT
ncbi:DUF2252 domain-containing protein [Rhodococcus oxybenzonivorans]|uniref:DUF2252 domain-containing protein n=1 Tax=Rhodococcus oxybenzonivorans TaxID=1990687 RepID=UPI002954CBAA|nr:DUF2252 domain-containing protein [Rhodococcus oxybenzonivorans]MDV7353955.1 DUF2252 domain-containing protein [Rhodococcus oxybenzonivorans]